jgi:hypothetical protein
MESQACVLEHVADKVELLPSIAQCRTVPPEQKKVVGQHSMHSPWLQNLPDSAQGVPPSRYSIPFALHVVAMLPLQVGWSGVQRGTTQLPAMHSLGCAHGLSSH